MLKIAALHKYIQLITNDLQRQRVSSVKSFKTDSENKRDRSTAFTSNALVWVNVGSWLFHDSNELNHS